MRPLVAAVLAIALIVPSAAMEAIVGNVRVQALAPGLVRLEEAQNGQFLDEPTMMVVNREWPGGTLRREGEDPVTITLDRAVVVIPDGGARLKGTEVRGLNGEFLYRFEGNLPPRQFLPSPRRVFTAWVIADTPRLVPPAWGAVAPPPDETSPTSGWRTDRDAPDLYVFLTEPGGYAELRANLLRLTGPTPIPPRYAFGLWHSRYHAYSEETALATIDRYRERGFPLDVFVVDTDWRVNASHGYAVDERFFPDMRRFIAAAHSRGVRLMANDHPEPQRESALDPAELRYREEGLRSLLELGMDAWWFDRNWHTSLREPMPGLNKDFWGMRLYHDITQRFAPQRRPLIMSNVDGIDNGKRNRPPHFGGQRYPIWWTGDTRSTWAYLRMGIANTVDAGVESLLPYVSEDLGGHFGNPNPELYVRWVQFGALSPIMRLHCTTGETRYPWDFGEEAEGIVREYALMRMRLLPTLYSAAREAFETGTPLLRRGDLEWPEHAEAESDQQYQLGPHLLVAPIAIPRDGEPTPIPLDMSRGGWQAEYFANPDLQGEPTARRVESEIQFAWGQGSPDPALPTDHFSARFTGEIGPMPQGGLLQLVAGADDGVRVWVDGEIVIDAWRKQGYTEFRAALDVEAGQRLKVKIEYFEDVGQAALDLGWVTPDRRRMLAERDVWIPPGTWFDLWTGEELTGPKAVRRESTLFHVPMFMRAGGMVLLGPERTTTADRPLDPITIEAYPSPEPTRTGATLYEDDGLSVAYLNGAFAKTPIAHEAGPEGMTVTISPRQGELPAPSPRAWIVRFQLPRGKSPTRLEVDGQIVELDDPRIRRVYPQSEGPTWIPPFSPGSAQLRMGMGGSLELQLDPADVTQPRTISLRF